MGYFWFELRKVDTDTVLKINSRSSHNRETKRIWGFQNRVAVFFKSQVDKEIEIRRTEILLVPPKFEFGANETVIGSLSPQLGQFTLFATKKVILT